jgi:hypothetical protein
MGVIARKTLDVLALLAPGHFLFVAQGGQSPDCTLSAGEFKGSGTLLSLGACVKLAGAAQFILERPTGSPLYYGQLTTDH